MFHGNKTSYNVKCIVIPSMSNTKNILLLAVIISLLVTGTSVLPMQATAQTQRDTQGEKQSIKEETTAQSANQKTGQDNLCVR